MNEGWKKWLITSAGFRAGFALTLAAVMGGGIWYASRPKPPKPWNRVAIQAEFLEPAASDEKDVINLWYTLKNTTAADYKINAVSEVTTAGWTANDDALYGFNQGISFDVPLIIPAHRKTKTILHVALGNPSVAGGISDAQASHESVEAFLSLDEAQQLLALAKVSSQAKMALLAALRVRMERSADAEATYKRYVMSFLRSEYSGLKGYVVMDEATRYEIDFALPGGRTGGNEVPGTRPEAKP